MNRAVLCAFGWDDLTESARREFLLDHEDEEDENESGKKSEKISGGLDDFRDDVFARLLELNKQRAKAEKLTGICNNTR